jgi:replicative DNA helicase
MRKSLFDGEWQDVFAFVRSFFSKHHRLPKLTTVKSKFPDLKFLKAHEGASYYADELRQRHAFQVLDRKLREDYTAARSEHDLDGSLEALKNVILTTERSRIVPGGGRVRINEGINRRKKEYKERKKKKGLLGIASPWKSLDFITMGWQPADLAVILARAGIGKTFFVLLCALAAMRKGKNVLVSSMEMFPSRLEIRYDALGAGVSVDRNRKGTLTKGERKKMNKWFEYLAMGKAGFVDLYGPNEISSPLDLELAINLGQYDLAIWDSFYLASKKKKWEEFAQLIADVKKVASRTGVPTLVTSQFNKEVKSIHTKSEQAAAAFSDSIVHDADFVFGLYQTPSMKLLHDMVLRSLKVREGVELNELMLKWDIDGGNFAESHSTILTQNFQADPQIDNEVDIYDYSEAAA